MRLFLGTLALLGGVAVIPASYPVHGQGAAPVANSSQQQAAPEERVVRWTVDLKDSDVRARRKAADKLGDLGAAAASAVPALLEALSDPAVSVREEVVDALGDISRRGGVAVANAALPGIERALKKDVDPSVRGEAAESLEQIAEGGSTLEIATRVVVALTQALADDHERVRSEVLEAIGGIARKFEPKLQFVRFQLERDSHSSRREETLRLLRRFESVLRDTSTTLARLYEPGKPGEPGTPYRPERGDDREDLVEALAHVARLSTDLDLDLVRVFVSALGDPEEDVRESAVDFLRDAARLGAEEAGNQSAVTEALVAAYRVGDPRLRREMVHVLEGLAPQPSTVAAIAVAARDVHRGIREAAVRALGRLAREASIGSELHARLVALLAEALVDPEDDVREEAAGILARLGASARESIPALIRALQHEDDSTREEAAESLGRIGVALPPTDALLGSLVAALGSALTDEEDDVRKEAARALGRMGPRARGAVDALRRATKDPEGDVRRMAERALERIEAPR